MLDNLTEDLVKEEINQNLNEIQTQKQEQNSSDTHYSSVLEEPLVIIQEDSNLNAEPNLNETLLNNNLIDKNEIISSSQVEELSNAQVLNQENAPNEIELNNNLVNTEFSVDINQNVCIEQTPISNKNDNNNNDVCDDQEAIISSEIEQINEIVVSNSETLNQPDQEGSNEDRNDSAQPEATNETDQDAQIEITDFKTEWEQLSDDEKMLGLIAPTWLSGIFFIFQIKTNWVDFLKILFI